MVLTLGQSSLIRKLGITRNLKKWVEGKLTNKSKAEVSRTSEGIPMIGTYKNVSV